MFFFNKNGLGYNPGRKNNVKRLFSSFFVPARTGYSSFSSSKLMFVPTCFYCMKFGHTSRTCKYKNYLVPKGLVKWLPRER